MRMPLGRRHDAKTVPTGSLSLRMTSRPSAMASIRAASRVRRSRKAAVAPEALASAKSSRLAARIAACEPRIALAMAASARFFWAAGASASARAALRASRPMSRIVASSLALPWPSIALRGAFMALIRLAFSVSYHVRAGAARRPKGRRLPTAIHNQSWSRQRKGGTSPRCRCSNFGNSQRIRRGCHASAN